jgi:hypothetical protein
VWFSTIQPSHINGGTFYLQKLKARPGFPLAPGQQYAKALVLDEEEGIQIPAAINTYLRNYQRDGVKFLWRQYKQGSGGLLGDDMGLVRAVHIASNFEISSHASIRVRSELP